MKTTKRKRPGLLLILGGLLLIAAALALVISNLREDQTAEARSKDAAVALAQIIPEGIPVPLTSLQPVDLVSDEVPELPAAGDVLYPDYMVNPNMDMPVRMMDDRRYIAILEIPALELELPILEEVTDEGLQYSPCRYCGTPYLKNMVICAHNYQSHFGRIHSLVPGDEVTLTDMAGNVFRYEVAEIETLRPTAVAAMKAGEYPLTLFTCTVGGQSRVTVRCAAVD